MPFGSIKLKPGINLEMTPSLNEAGFSFSNLIRFREGMVEKLGGWQKFFPSDMGSPVRGLAAWQDLNANLYLGVGSEETLQCAERQNAGVVTTNVARCRNFEAGWCFTHE
jgi:hypothetical protein